MRAVTATPPPPSFGQRFFLAFACFFRVLFDARFAGRMTQPEALPAAPAGSKVEAPPAKVEVRVEMPPQPPEASALSLLALLQREGRLVDFLQQDLTGFDDTDVGVAARVVHEGCRKALLDHATLEPLRTEEEGSRVTLEAGYDAHTVKLTGDVRGSAPFRGVLRHRGWRASKLSLPLALDEKDLNVLAPAEVEL